MNYTTGQTWLKEQEHATFEHFYALAEDRTRTPQEAKIIALENALKNACDCLRQSLRDTRNMAYVICESSEYLCYTLMTEAGRTWHRATTEQVKNWAACRGLGNTPWAKKVDAFLNDQCFEGDGAWMDRADLVTLADWTEIRAEEEENGVRFAFDYIPETV